MKIKNFQKTQNTIPKNKTNKAILEALLVTDGSVIPKRNQISFANTSKELIQRFCNLVNDVYGYEVPITRIGIGKGTKQKLYLVQFRSKEICKDLLKDTEYNTTKDVSIPESWFEMSDSQTAEILRNLFDADGGCSLRISWLKKKRCFEIERTVFLTSNNPKLINQYRELLEKIGITTGKSSGKVTITSKENIKKFRNLVNFSKNVLIGFDSKHWQGIEKRELLDIILETYSIPRGQIQKFKEKNEIYDFLASFQVNTVTES